MGKKFQNIVAPMLWCDRSSRERGAEIKIPRTELSLARKVMYRRWNSCGLAIKSSWWKLLV